MHYDVPREQGLPQFRIVFHVSKSVPSPDSSTLERWINDLSIFERWINKGNADVFEVLELDENGQVIGVFAQGYPRGSFIYVNYDFYRPIKARYLMVQPDGSFDTGPNCHSIRGTNQSSIIEQVVRRIAIEIRRWSR